MDRKYGRKIKRKTAEKHDNVHQMSCAHISLASHWLLNFISLVYKTSKWQRIDSTGLEAGLTLWPVVASCGWLTEWLVTRYPLPATTRASYQLPLPLHLCLLLPLLPLLFLIFRWSSKSQVEQAAVYQKLNESRSPHNNNKMEHIKWADEYPDTLYSVLWRGYYGADLWHWYQGEVMLSFNNTLNWLCLWLFHFSFGKYDNSSLYFVFIQSVILVYIFN